MRLVIDISELAAWRGRLTGVPRVMSELAYRFNEGGDTIFIAWDGQAHLYREIDFPNIAEEDAKETAALPTRSVLRRGVHRIRTRSRLADRTVGYIVNNLRKAMSAPSASPDAPEGLKLSSGDTLFVMADWHGSDTQFVEYLVSIQKAGVQIVQMCYDLLPLVTPQYSGHATETLTNYAKKIYPISSKIITISEHTKRDVKAWLSERKLTVPPIDVIRLGDDFHMTKPVAPSEVDRIGKFILCVGTIESRKNHTLLYYTYRLAAERGIELPPLVIVGRRGWKTDDLYEILTHDLQVKDKFVILESASDENLSWLYGNCLFTIYPSFYEGWGLPISESVNYGTPCLCSNTSSMPEVAGDLVTYFSPFSTDECLKAVLDMLKPGAIEASKERLKTYRPTLWDDTFESVKKGLGRINEQ